jgi:exonuclease III
MSDILEQNFIQCTENYDVKSIKAQSESLSVFHVNIRSLKNKEHLNELINLLSTFEFSFDIIVVTETWINSKDDHMYINLPNYKYESFIRKGRGGGITIFIKENINCKRLESVQLIEAESVFIEIKTMEGHIILGAIYRPPDKNLYKFTREIDNITNDFNKKNKLCVLIGDFNIDLLKETSCEYVNMLASNGFKQCIVNIPTRETVTSKTLLDHVYTNVNNKYLDTGVIHTDISDHKPIYCIINNMSCKFFNMSNKTALNFNEKK